MGLLANPEGGFRAETEEEVEDGETRQKAETGLAGLPVGERGIGINGRIGSFGGIGREEQQALYLPVDGEVEVDDRGVAVDRLPRDEGEEAVDVEFEEGCTPVGRLKGDAVIATTGRGR